ncbi:MAG TPA: ATPase, T2SS/T4P/T4SS family, partial [Terriglobia bacterium]|nr:ATPase, T2SS/T4P/T4SS family [Terriglobia bacterium]
MSTQTLVARLGEILLKDNRINDEQLRKALDYQKQHGGKLGQALVKLGFVTDEQVAEALGIQYGIPSIRLREFPVDPAVVKMIPVETAMKHHVLPLVRMGSSLTLAMSDPANVFALDDVKFLTGLNVEPVLASEASIEEAIKSHYGTVEEAERQKEIDDLVSFLDEGAAGSVELDEAGEDTLNLADIEKAAEEAPVIRLVNYVLTDAVKRGASDIHMEPYEKEYRVRYRIDGLLQTVMSPPLKLRDAIISRVKIMAKLDIAEKRLPQDGRIMLKLMHQSKRKQLDLRVSVLPTLHGEKIVM